MSNRDWLSLAEIARLWSDECGRSAEDLERDLDAWFSDFVAREPAEQLASSNGDGDTTNRLMGMLGGRYLERQTFEIYCQERGHPKPRFWSSGRNAEPRRDAARPLRPAAAEPQAAPKQSGDEPPAVRPAQDPDLESFQTQIAGMSERLTAPNIEYSSLGEAPAADQAEAATQPGEPGPSMERDQRALIERAEAASAKARQLKLQLETAERQISELSGSGAAGRAAAAAPPCGPDPATTEAPGHRAKKSAPPERRASAGYRDPSVTHKMLQQGARRKGRGRKFLLAGLAIPVAALFLWGGLTAIQGTSKKPIPPSIPAPILATPAQPIQSGPVSQSLEPATEALGFAGKDFTQPNGPWDARSTDPTAAELDAARQRLEAAMRHAGADAGPSRQKLLLAAEIARAQAALYKQDLDAALERVARSKSETQTANARAEILAKELIETRRRHSAAVEIADADDNSARRQLARDAMAASDRASSIERDLSAARRRIAGLKAQLSAANSDTADLTRQLAQLRREHAALLEIFRVQAEQRGR